MVYLCTITLAAQLLCLMPAAAAFDVPQSDQIFTNGTTAADDSAMAERLSTIVRGAAASSMNAEFIEVEHQGRTRDAILYVPPATPTGTALPLVFNYHGFGSDGLQQVVYSFMNPLADEEHFAVLYPYGVGIAGVGRSHNGGSCCPVANSRDDPTDDVGCAIAWVAEVSRQLADRGLSLDRSRIYSTGMSNGGFMSLRLGCEAAQIFAAVSTVTGVLGNESPNTDDFECGPTSTGGLSVPLLHIHGTADSTVPYSGVARGVETFRAINRCSETGEPVQTYSRGNATCFSYCPLPLPNVTLCSITGGGHDWFGSPLCEIVGGREIGCSDIDSTREIWAFFKRYSREMDDTSTRQRQESPMSGASGEEQGTIQ